MTKGNGIGTANRIERVVIVGGGTAGWMTAAAMSRFFNDGRRTITLIESEAIGTVGVGEATIPPIRNFNAMLDIPENEFLHATRGTYKLGIEFVNWGRKGDRYFHPFGSYGQDFHGIQFHHLFLREHARGMPPGEVGEFSMSTMAARAGRFARPAAGARSLVSQIAYAYQFDAGLYASYLRTLAERQQVQRKEGRITAVQRDGETGDVTSVQLEDGSLIEGELFIDCSGFRGLLIEDTLETGFEDWTHWLPCDRAAAMPCSHASQALRPYTTATAMPAGWRWQIPLQHRMGNGYVFSSAHLDEDQACEAIKASAEGTPLAEPRILRFRPGRRAQSWSHNVIGVGLASGFLEPLESTSIYLAQMAITYLIELFPQDGRIDPRDRDEFNRLVDMEYDRVRDFLILHYHATTRDDSEFWNHVRTMTVPGSLADKLELWRRAGRIEKYSDGLFYDASWIAVYIGQGLLPERYDPRPALGDPAQLARAAERLREAIAQEVNTMPDHQAFLLSEAARVAQAA